MTYFFRLPDRQCVVDVAPREERRADVLGLGIEKCPYCEILETRHLPDASKDEAGDRDVHCESFEFYVRRVADEELRSPSRASSKTLDQQRTTETDSNIFRDSEWRVGSKIAPNAAIQPPRFANAALSCQGQDSAQQLEKRNDKKQTNTRQK